MRSLGSGSLSYEPVEEFRGNQRSGQPLPFLDRQAGRKLDPPLGPLDLRGEDVAAAAHRLDHRRLFQVVFELTPKPADLDIDRAIEWPGLAITGDTERLLEVPECEAGHRVKRCGALFSLTNRLKAVTATGGRAPMNIEQQTRRRHSPTHFNKRTADSDRDLSPKHAEILTQVSASIGSYSRNLVTA